MADMNEAWIVAETPSVACELAAAADAWAERTVLVYAGAVEGASLPAVDAAYGLPAGQSVGLCASAVAELIAGARPDVVLVQACANGRLIAALVAARLGTAVLSDSTEIAIEGGRVVARKLFYGGAAIKTESAPRGAAVVIAGEGLFEPAEAAFAGAVEQLAAGPVDMTLVETRERTVAQVNLASAKHVVGVGRGLGDAEGLPAVEAFAASIDAELACTRPVAEEEQWLAKERYLGVSGKRIKPEVYVALGVSGQVQHMVGVNDADTIIAINKDANAPIFKQCDFGLVADIHAALPALTEAL